MSYIRDFTVFIFPSTLQCIIALTIILVLICDTGRIAAQMIEDILTSDIYWNSAPTERTLYLMLWRQFHLFLCNCIMVVLSYTSQVYQMIAQNCLIDIQVKTYLTKRYNYGLMRLYHNSVCAIDLLTSIAVSQCSLTMHIISEMYAYAQLGFPFIDILPVVVYRRSLLRCYKNIYSINLCFSLRINTFVEKFVIVTQSFCLYKCSHCNFKQISS